jgi:hypothetical protein
METPGKFSGGSANMKPGLTSEKCPAVSEAWDFTTEATEKST